CRPPSHQTHAWPSASPGSHSSFIPVCEMLLKSLSAFIPEPLIVRHPVPYGPELRRDEAIAAFSTMPLLGHEAGIEQDAEVLRDGWAAHLEMSRKRIDVQPPLESGQELRRAFCIPERQAARESAF